MFFSLRPLAPFLFPGYFGLFENVLRIIFNNIASLVTEPKEARQQELMNILFEYHVFP